MSLDVVLILVGGLVMSLSAVCSVATRRATFKKWARRHWHEVVGQDVAEYAVMLAVILVVVIGTIRLVGSNASNVFSGVASSMGSGQ